MCYDVAKFIYFIYQQKGVPFNKSCKVFIFGGQAINLSARSLIHSSPLRKQTFLGVWQSSTTDVLSLKLEKYIQYLPYFVHKYPRFVLKDTNLPLIKHLKQSVKKV